MCIRDSDEGAYDSELTFLRQEIYRREEADPVTVTLTALDRFKAA